jgi:hypothetical protein
MQASLWKRQLQIKYMSTLHTPSMHTCINTSNWKFILHIYRALHILSVGPFVFLYRFYLTSLNLSFSNFSSTPLKYCAHTVFHVRFRLMFNIWQKAFFLHKYYEAHFWWKLYEQKDIMPITVAARSETRNVFVYLNTGIVVSNPTRDMDVAFLWLWYPVYAAAWRHIQGVQLTVYKILDFQIN